MGFDMLKEEQKKAVDFVLRHLMSDETRSVGLVGWAGTGKTFTTAEIIRELYGLNVSVLAPTHRACGVLEGELRRAGIHCDVDTVHRGCGLIPCDETGKAISVVEPLAKSADVVFIDEASMVSTELLVAINKLPGKKVFIGDPYQLPPVGEKTPPAFVGIPVATLTETVRYAPGSDLDELTDALRQCIAHNKLPSVDAIRERMTFFDGGIETAADLYNESEGCAVVLGYTNEAVARTCAKIQGEDVYCFKVGERISFLERWAPYVDGQGAKGKFITRAQSGTEGVIVGVDGDLVHVEYDDGGSAIVPVVPPGSVTWFLGLKRTVGAMYNAKREQWQRMCDSTPALKRFRDKSSHEAKRELSQYACVRQTWASTVHKAQGGSYDRAIVLWDDIMKARREPALFSRLLYVAVTRSRDVNQLYFVRG